MESPTVPCAPICSQHGCDCQCPRMRVVVTEDERTSAAIPEAARERALTVPRGPGYQLARVRAWLALPDVAAHPLAVHARAALAGVAVLAADSLEHTVTVTVDADAFSAWCAAVGMVGAEIDRYRGTYWRLYLRALDAYGDLGAATLRDLDRDLRWQRETRAVEAGGHHGV